MKGKDFWCVLLSAWMRRLQSRRFLLNLYSDFQVFFDSINKMVNCSQSAFFPDREVECRKLHSHQEKSSLTKMTRAEIVRYGV